MSFLYFAYGSNMWPPQMRARCLTAAPVGATTVLGWQAVFNKPSIDGSSKLNLWPASAAATPGVLYRIDDSDLAVLDDAEPGYQRIEVDCDGQIAITYRYSGIASMDKPYDWYRSIVLAGARHHGLPTEHLDIADKPDPIAAGVRPGEEPDLELMASILSKSMTDSPDRYTIHPGDLYWWVYHDDPRYPDSLSFWLWGEEGFAVLYSQGKEMSVFTLPGVDRRPLLDWAMERRAGRSWELGWVGDQDEEMMTRLKSSGFEPVAANRSYEWDLDSISVPSPNLGEEWALRAIHGEVEADSRRAAAHAAFESEMDAAMHLERYLGFMRSPRYDRERDLVAVAPDGRVASFIVWWPDPSGIAQVEPFGTHPDFQRQGVGRALIYFALGRMRAAGMHKARVLTDEPRAATAFYEGVGFTDVGRVRWWRLLP